MDQNTQNEESTLSDILATEDLDDEVSLDNLPV